jgi:hypothetical protein
VGLLGHIIAICEGLGTTLRRIYKIMVDCHNNQLGWDFAKNRWSLQVKNRRIRNIRDIEENGCNIANGVWGAEG